MQDDTSSAWAAYYQGISHSAGNVATGLMMPEVVVKATRTYWWIVVIVALCLGAWVGFGKKKGKY